MLSTMFNLFLFGIAIRILAKATYLIKGKNILFTMIRTCDWMFRFCICTIKVIFTDLSNISKKLYKKTNKIMQNKTKKYNEHKSKNTTKQPTKKVVNGIDDNDFYDCDNVIELSKRRKK